ncbi:MAG: D-2-hydroxyacid dehydrogenase family protein [Pseudomonadota bacterium]
MARIAVLDDYQNLAKTLADWSAIEKAHDVTVFNQQLVGEDAVTAALSQFDVICVMRERTPFPANQIAKLANLKLIVTAGMRNAAIDIAAAEARGVTVCGTPSPRNSQPTAELALGSMIALARHVPAEAANMTSGGWQSTVGTELAGKTLGIIGLGKLGTAMAGFGGALGMNVIAWSQNLEDAAASAAGAQRVTKNDLFRQADVVTIHTRLSDRTRGLVGASELGLMKPTATLINTSRGPIIDTDALLTALRAKQIAGCALDVFDEEPLPTEHPLRSEPRALLTPHLGYWTHETLTSWYGGMVDAIAAWQDGNPIRMLTT